MANRKKTTLSEMERRFVEAYMGQCAGNATQAAILAGYSEKTAGSTGSRLLKRAKIARALKARAASDPKIATATERQQLWTAVMLGVKPYHKTPMKDRLKASELLGKTQGDFIERHEIVAPVPLFALPPGVQPAVHTNQEG